MNWRRVYPPLAEIADIDCQTLPTRGHRPFNIKGSLSRTERRALVPPDISICHDCLAELFNPTDRRYLYPFTTCTNCGPRYTIIQDIPYDRLLTTMSEFTMSPQCQRECEDPTDRRFHAQTNACWDCGPRLQLLDGNANIIECDDPIACSRQLLAEGKILAIKGLGGFHLAVDAENDSAVRELRQRKGREMKPFAMMSRDLQQVSKYCRCSPEEAKLLKSPRRPIVLLKKRKGNTISEQVAPTNNYFGVMLPYTPLHYLLLSNTDAQRHSPTPSALVMTSGNLSDEPMATSNHEAIENLSRIADYLLIHDSEIHTRADDSIVRFQSNTPIVLRRSRGYVPTPIKLKHSRRAQEPEVLAVGGELKNTVCLVKGDEAFVSQHIGDLQDIETRNFFEEAIIHLKQMFDIEPRIIAHDLHPDYFSTRFALESSHRLDSGETARHPADYPTLLPLSSCEPYESEASREVKNHAKVRNLRKVSPPAACSSKSVSPLKTIGVQHHHAHIASCLAEHGVEEGVIGIAFDGTGYGTDGTIWGGEFMVANLRSFKRCGHLQCIPLPGGDRAIKEPWRSAVSYLYTAFGDDWLDLPIDFVREIDKRAASILVAMVVKGLNSPLTSSAGRLFDAVSSLLRLCDNASYEGEAAIRLESIIPESPHPEAESYDFYVRETSDGFIIQTTDIIKGVVEDIESGVKASAISAKFHNTIADAAATSCLDVRERYGLRQVAISGGVFQNLYLTETLTKLLVRRDFDVIRNESVPPDDGVSLGQAAIAHALERASRIT